MPPNHMTLQLGSRPVARQAIGFALYNNCIDIVNNSSSSTIVEPIGRRTCSPLDTLVPG